MIQQKHTKIVATIGPASQNPEIIERMVLSGVDVFRLNFSHGNHQSHLKTIKTVKKIRQKLRRAVAILQDLTGPKIRLGKITSEPLQVKPGDFIILDGTFKGSSAGNRISVNYSGFAEDVFPGARLLLADGDLELEVSNIEGSAVYCKVILSGGLYSHKGVNFPTGTFKIPPLTEKDKEDLIFGLNEGVNLVAMSFVRSANDLEMAHDIFKKVGRTVPLIAKIEKHEALDNLDEIIQASDGVMVARGDLGVEIEIESVPIIQKKIIKQTNIYGKPVITATQMLRSMVDSPTPTRAEVTDVANAILDGTDAIMLSEESAIGKYPVKAVCTMTKIAGKVEEYSSFFKDPREMNRKIISLIPDSISHSATILSKDLNARVIFAITRTGYTAKAIAKFRPKSLILALTPDEEVYYQLALIWGVLPAKYDLQKNQNTLFDDTFQIAKEMNVVDRNDHYVFASGYPLGKPGSINQVTAGRIP